SEELAGEPRLFGSLGENEADRFKVATCHGEDVRRLRDQFIRERLAALAGNINTERPQHFDRVWTRHLSMDRADAGRTHRDVPELPGGLAKQAFCHGASADV